MWLRTRGSSENFGEDCGGEPPRIFWVCREARDVVLGRYSSLFWSELVRSGQHWSRAVRGTVPFLVDFGADELWISGCFDYEVPWERVRVLGRTWPIMVEE